MMSQVQLIITAFSFVSLSLAQDSTVVAQSEDKNSDAQFHVAKGYYFTKGVSTDGAKHADGSMYLSGHFVKPSLSFGGGDSGWTAPTTSGGWTAPTTTVGWTAPTVGWSAPTLGWTAPASTGNYAIWAPNWDIWNSATYCVAVIAAVASIWYVCSVVGTWGSWGTWGKQGASKKTSVVVKETELKDEDDEEESDGKGENAKTRRRRSAEADADFNRLSSLVLSAIESGECLQKTICIFGSQIGARKGRVASLVLDKMLPPDVQSNTYVMTFKKALKGEMYCQKFRCKH